MANVYSSLLYSNALGVPAGTYNSSNVPAGFVWVVRDIVLENNDIAEPVVLAGCLVTDNNGAPIFGALPPLVQPFRLYHWTGHQVLNHGTNIEVSAGDAGWIWRISGYVLTLP